ncbi:molecular chaperone HtpG [Halosquirtibacter xylanolyticus]|uniref:molecular chaperone HtpG n=1 Tax=Halosquirtibacter xylanolyticus TaxID=3374599 RepID=UPI0037479DCD|nr:molecular chaperone HtpG [Prolixibacteraceae bacterium]
MQGKIGVTSENLFPIIKKFLYSDHDIFLREIVSNAVDATQKLKTLASVGQYNGNTENLKVRVSIDKEAQTLTISDNGIGLTSEEMDKYLNQIAFSGATEFLEKYKDDANAIIGHFGLGFYSSFMVSSKVDVISLSHKEGSTAAKWSCSGSPEYTIEDTTRAGVGTDVVMHINEESKEFLEEARIQNLLDKYCKFLPIEIVFGEKKEWKDGKEESTGEENVINDTHPAWTKKPADLKEEDYTKFYRQLYPMGEDPMFHIHLNVDYPFNLTGVLYFPRLKNNVEIQKNKIQLYCNQVFVTDHVEGIVPEFLTLLHGVIDSPDIPLNVSRSYLQSDSNVKKISSHITKKVADRLHEIFKNQREDFEAKWDDLKIFIEYGMLSEEKFYDRAMKFYLLKNTDGKAFTWEEYENIIKENQTDKDNKMVYLYATDQTEQYSFIEAAKAKGYDVLLMDDMLATHMLNKLEQKFPEKRFVRVDSNVADKLIEKENENKQELTAEEKGELSPIFEVVTPSEQGDFMIDFEDLGEDAQPMVITQNEFMRRMKDMSSMQPGMNMYGDMTDRYNLVVNIAHPLVKQVFEQKDSILGADLERFAAEIQSKKSEVESLNKLKEGKKEEEVSQEEKDQMTELNNDLSKLEQDRRIKLQSFGKDSALAKQLVDLALLANNMLKGKALNEFVQRSVRMIK